MGPATAELFVEEGALVYITGRRREPLDAATDRIGPRLRGVVADASSLDDIEHVFSTIRSEAGRETAGQSPVPNAQDAPSSVSMVAGVQDHHAPSGYKPDEAAGHRACPMQPPRRCTTQFRRPVVGVPRNSQPGRTFGLRAMAMLRSPG